MYEQFYGLSDAPFALLPDPDFLYMSKDHSVALTLLRYSVLNKQGFTVITGEVGAGKTTLVNRIIGELDDDITVGLINFTHNSFGELSEWVLMSYGLEYRDKTKVEIYDTFVKFLIDEYAAGRRVVLIIDEAQNMSPAALEEVRMLSNVNAQKDYLLHLILVGQPELRATLERYELRQLAQRVSVFYHLGELSVTEAEAYVRHRITCVGGDGELFTAEAVKMIWEQARGLPRVMNTLCDMALVYGFSSGLKQIDAAVVREVIADRNRMSLHSEPPRHSAADVNSGVDASASADPGAAGPHLLRTARD
ncbi:MAG: AAA family ATPase [Gammaproteobacteria bacterium]|jgi:type II secretory pathway predicted ATPase ExeA|nr:AAA family ATPase [Gammaproteobacteria bacterium]